MTNIVAYTNAKKMYFNLFDSPNKANLMSMSGGVHYNDCSMYLSYFDTYVAPFATRPSVCGGEVSFNNTNLANTNINMSLINSTYNNLVGLSDTVNINITGSSLHSGKFEKILEVIKKTASTTSGVFGFFRLLLSTGEYLVICDKSTSLGSGGQGSVFRGYKIDNATNIKEVAVKIAHTTVTLNPTTHTNIVKNLYNEIITLNNVNALNNVIRLNDVLVCHGNTISTHTFKYDNGTLPGAQFIVENLNTVSSIDTTTKVAGPFDANSSRDVVVFLVTDLLKGCSIDDYINKAVNATHKFTNIATAIAKYEQTVGRRKTVCTKMNEIFEVLKKMHKLGLTHNDIKPGNIYVDVNGTDNCAEDPYDMTIKLIDFGYGCPINTYSINQTDYNNCIGTVGGMPEYWFPLFTRYLMTIGDRGTISSVLDADVKLIAQINDTWQFFIVLCEILLFAPQQVYMRNLHPTISNKWGRANAFSIDIYNYVMSSNTVLSDETKKLIDSAQTALEHYIYEMFMGFLDIIKNNMGNGQAILTAGYDFIEQILLEGVKINDL